ncbi:MAG: DUF3300 domain-containing protein [Syntrophobacteraceae bacterium]|nr:DUF3300 domain-containing protein [Syntrophobacteraceae bacterium]
MKAKTLFVLALLGVFMVMSAPCKVFAQGEEAPAVSFSQQELDQMLAPVALYPDSLLAQILIAATFPNQVMDANNWLKAHPGMGRDQLNAELDRMDWDMSIKALAPFPQVLDMMAQQLEWTQRLGEAFLAQQGDVMDAVQRLRRKAEQAGNLRATSQQNVVETDGYVEIQPINPDVVYVPRYDPAVVYGAWWWPAYPPLVYYPVWPGVVFAPVVGVYGFWGSVGVGPAWGWGWGSWGWGSHNVYMNVNRTVNINTRNVTVINNMHRNYRIASARNLGMAGRIGSPAVRRGAFGTSRANPAALNGHVMAAKVSHGRVTTASGARLSTAGRGSLPSGLAAQKATRRNTSVTGAGGHVQGHPGMTKSGTGRTITGGHTGGLNSGKTTGVSRSGLGAQGTHGGRPSSSDVMRGLHGGKTGAGGAHNAGGHAGAYGSGHAQGGHAMRNVHNNASHGAFGGAPRGASHGSYGGAAHNNFGGASRGAPRGAFGGGHVGGGHVGGGHVGGGHVGGGHVGGGHVGGGGGGNNKKHH